MESSDNNSGGSRTSAEREWKDRQKINDDRDIICGSEQTGIYAQPVALG